MAYAELTSGWSQVSVMAAVGDAGFVVSGGTLYRLDTDGGYIEMSTGWDPVAMVGCKGKLYLFSADAAMYCIDPKDGSYEQMESTWPDVTGATAYGDKIYVVCQTQLYAVDP